MSQPVHVIQLDFKFCAVTLHSSPWPQTSQELIEVLREERGVTYWAEELRAGFKGALILRSGKQLAMKCGGWMVSKRYRGGYERVLCMGVSQAEAALRVTRLQMEGDRKGGATDLWS